MPHQSDKDKLLMSDPPDLCFNCHDKAIFEKKNVHPPVAGGMCLTCHSPHSTENIFQLVKPVNDLCVTCHTDEAIGSGMHVIRGFSQQGHPMRAKKDPLRKDRQFDCTGCHDPHSSDWMKLFRYQANAPFELCQNCHKK
jgi:predicted CXXCH cytochrome family protein